MSQQLSEFCAVAVGAVVSAVCSIQIFGADPLPGITGVIGAYIAVSLRDQPMAVRRVIVSVIAGGVVSGVFGLLLTQWVHSKWPELSGLAIASSMGMAIGFASVSGLPVLAKSFGNWVAKFVSTKIGGGQ